MAGLMEGRRGLIVGVANDHSIAWGIARRLAKEGAQLAFTYQPPKFEERVRRLAASVNCNIVLPCDASIEPGQGDPIAVDAMLAGLREHWTTIDFLVHAVAFSDKSELRGRYADTSRANFTSTMLVSCFSLTELMRLAAPMMTAGSSVLTLTYGGSTRVMPNYNVMGIAKAALESSVRYLAADFGSDNIRVNAISAGPVRTLAGSGVSDSRLMFNYQANNAPLGRTPTIDDIGGAALYFLSDLSSAVTGEVHFVDAGYNVMAMPRTGTLKEQEANEAAAAADAAAPATGNGTKPRVAAESIP